jgi:hypothetical protein
MFKYITFTIFTQLAMSKGREGMGKIEEEPHAGAQSCCILFYFYTSEL